MRYRFYRVHKIVCFQLSEFDRATAKTDFVDPQACTALKEKLHGLTQLLKHHAEYEDAHIHDLLRQKANECHLTIEHEHQTHERDLHQLMSQLDQIIQRQSEEEKILGGNAFYLAFRLFHSEMLKHLYEEETILLPALQALYSDAELAALQAKTYQRMTPNDMAGMLNGMLPHVNPEDFRFFVEEMRAAAPEKINAVLEMMPEDLASVF